MSTPYPWTNLSLEIRPYLLKVTSLNSASSNQSLTVGSAKECELSYLSHCSCTAYAYKNGCSLWNGDLINLQQLSDGEGQDHFVRLAASELRSLGPKKRRIDEATLGKRNAEQLGDGESAFFPCCAAEKIVEEEVLALLDFRLDGITNIEELRRASRVACWCIQDNENNRPSMELVVQILEGVKDVSMPPIPWSIKILTDNSSLVSS
ncbi:hypothetical protein MRB53_021711 [Persea americana]|uniref:Uncharacterized protein n=1 Tax=Persea americana TaxID=3435 RepID=A0ACC2L4N0_PERAE|nr:hypothetical protein MRB53_021711 [Persea americana]